MKKSKYNLIVKRERETYLYNILTGGLTIIDDQVEEYLNSNLKSNIKKQYEDLLKEEQYIIDNNIDEDKILNYQYLKTQFNKQHLGLVIAPTLECNFSCPYCFESRIKGKMTEKIQIELIKFIEAKVTEGVSKIEVTWYSGEPLLYQNIISNLTKRILKICQTNNIRYGAYIITNGYLINEKNIKLFIDNKIRGAQITIDGPSRIHNTRRTLKNGIDTFDTLINNIKTLINHNVEVSIRINVDKTNEIYLEELIQELANRKLNNCKIAIGHVQSYTEVCKSIETNCVTKHTFRNLEYEFAD